MDVDRRPEEYVIDSNKVIEFKLIREPGDIENDDLVFLPTMSHQIFGPAETIYGYKDLRVKLYFSAAQLTPYINISYSEKVAPTNKSSVEADNVEAILVEKLMISFHHNIDEFYKLLANEHKFKPMGKLLHSFKVASEDCDLVFVVHKCDLTTIGLIPYHERLQTFILWFIDAASFICLDDEKWQFFLIFEKYKKDGEDMYAIAGFATVYEYYAYPEHIRPRISQILILPPFQRQGLGAQLLMCVYNYYKANDMVRDITVEDSSDELQSVRDYVDSQLCAELPSVQNANPLTLDIIEKAAVKFKFNKKQARRVYEILRLKKVNKNNAEEYRQYRLEVKKRLNMPHHYEVNKLKKMELHMKPQEIAELRSALHLKDELRLATLERSFKELEEQYERVISRLQLDESIN